jgi:hypothetical protein
MESTESGSTKSAAPPLISGKHEAFEVSTGVPQDMASTTGSPKVSQMEGKTKARAPA